METSSGAFFRPPITSLRKTNISSVRLVDGHVTEDLPAVCLEFVRHWGIVFGDTSVPVQHERTISADAQEQLIHSITRALDDEAHSTLDAPITASALAESIRHMKATSAPGLDGLTAGFFKINPDLFGEILSLVFNYQLQHGVLLPSQRKSCVHLLFKIGDRSNPGNYRPISLMQVDVKILSKTLACRLCQVLHLLIHPDQKGFVKGRSLHHHIRFLQDLRHYATTEDLELFATLLDFEKAYDMANWDCMLRVLVRMGIGENFVAWINLLYTRSNMRLLLNGFLQKPIFPTRGVKQGDSLSAFLFILVIEPLGNLLRQKQELGIRLRSDHVATGLYFADDSTLLSNSPDGVRQQLAAVQTYCAGSGAKLNLVKSALLALNRKRVPPIMSDIHSLQPTEQVKYLRMPFGQRAGSADLVDTLEAKFYNGFGLWFRKARTLRGRLLVIQTMILSLFWHYTPHITVPEAKLARWQSMVNKFALTRKHDKDTKFVQLLHSDFLYQSRSLGGLPFPRLIHQIQVQRLQLLQQFVRLKLVNSPEHWCVLGSVILDGAVAAPNRAGLLAFLDVSPVRRPQLLRYQTLSEWWKTTWLVWHRTRWSASAQDFDPVDQTTSLTSSNVWASREPMLQYKLSDKPARTVMQIPGTQRSFRQRFAAASSIVCSRDLATEDHVWPSKENFIHKYMDHASRHVHLGLQCRWLGQLYTELTQISS